MPWKFLEKTASKNNSLALHDLRVKWFGSDGPLCVTQHDKQGLKTLVHQWEVLLSAFQDSKARRRMGALASSQEDEY